MHSLEPALFWLQAQMVNKSEVSRGSKKEANECGPRGRPVARTDSKVLDLLHNPLAFNPVYWQSAGQAQAKARSFGAGQQHL